MGIRFACHQCDKRLNVKRDLAGKRGVCPQCSTRFRIPEEDAEKSTPILRSEPKSAGANLAARASLEERATLEESSHDSAASIDLLADEPSSTWYVRPPTGGQYGPATSKVLRSWINEGRVAAASLLWRDGWPQWRVASEVLPDLIKPLPAESLEPASETSSPPTSTALSKPDVSLDGSPDIGVVRRSRSGRRILTIGVLLAIAITLIVALVIVALR